MTLEQVGVLRGLALGALGGLFVAVLGYIAIDCITDIAKRETVDALRKIRRKK
jgi:hypothetical protein